MIILADDRSQFGGEVSILSREISIAYRNRMFGKKISGRRDARFCVPPLAPADKIGAHRVLAGDQPVFCSARVRSSATRTLYPFAAAAKQVSKKLQQSHRDSCQSTQGDGFTNEPPLLAAGYSIAPMYRRPSSLTDFSWAAAFGNREKSGTTLGERSRLATAPLKALPIFCCCQIKKGLATFPWQISRCR